MELNEKIKRLHGPILILGGNGFVGANLFRTLLQYRDDVYATTTRIPTWRFEEIPLKNIIMIDLLVESNLDKLLTEISPQTVFNCVAYGAYSFEKDSDLIYQTNFNLTAKLLNRWESKNITSYIHAGSSSEYGDNSEAPLETELPTPNSHYAVSKSACSILLNYYGKKKNFPCANLRLYSVYGPMEDSSRLIPKLIRCNLAGNYPEFVDPEISRDFIYIDDVCEAFIDTANNLKEEDYGESFNIGTGCMTTIRELAELAGDIFQIKNTPQFSSIPNRDWDVSNWYANPAKAMERLGWQAKTSLRQGLLLTAEWYKSLADKESYHLSSKQNQLDQKYSVSAIIACYKDAKAIPIMYDHLKNTFEKLKIDYQIIFVNDNSPDESEEIIRKITSTDRRVIGISHSRNFGSQAAFRSGMEIATKNACVLLDGDLQDPPELIEKFVEKWREGYDVIYGIRKKREAPIYMQIAYKTFYRVFDYFSYLSIPHDAGDFSLLDKKVVAHMLRFPERDLFWRGVRAYVGFNQTGVDYVRPERMFGVSTNNLAKNINWAKKGILSFSNTPLNILSFVGSVLLLLSLMMAIFQISTHFIFPGLAPRGVTTLMLVILFFGSLNLFAIGIIGEYVSKMFEEVKQRPHFIRRNIIKGGDIKDSFDSR